LLNEVFQTEFSRLRLSPLVILFVPGIRSANSGWASW